MMMPELQPDRGDPGTAEGEALEGHAPSDNNDDLAPPTSSRDPVAVLRELLQLMGFEVQVSSRREEDRLVLNLDGPDATALIGKKGQTLDALQFLLNKIVSRDADEHPPVVLDSNGYRQRRTDALVQLAQRLSEKVVRTGKIVAVNPMSAHDRRIIHLALKETPGVTTRSEGEGIYRRLLIVPTSGSELEPEPDVDSDLEPDPWNR